MTSLSRFYTIKRGHLIKIVPVFTLVNQEQNLPPSAMHANNANNIVSDAKASFNYNFGCTESVVGIRTKQNLKQQSSKVVVHCESNKRYK